MIEEIEELENLSKTKSFSSLSIRDSNTVMIVDAVNLAFKLEA